MAFSQSLIVIGRCNPSDPKLLYLGATVDLAGQPPKTRLHRERRNRPHHQPTCRTLRHPTHPGSTTGAGNNHPVKIRSAQLGATHPNPRNQQFNQISNKFKNRQKTKITAHHSTSPQSQFKKPTPKSCPSLNPRNPGSDNFSELVLNSVKKQSCRDFAAKLPSQGQSCSKFHFQPNPKILRKPPFHTLKRRYPLHPPHHTPNPATKHPRPDLASTAAASGNQRQFRGDTTSQ